MKAVDKYYQFGLDKCMAMIVGKKVEHFLVPNLEVDIWQTKHDKNGQLFETFEGKKPMTTKAS